MKGTLLARFSEYQPVLLAPQSAELVSAYLQAVEQDDKAAELRKETMSHDSFWLSDDDWRSAFRPYIVRDGVLVIPIRGVLLHDFPWQYGRWATGYEYIWKAYERGMADYAVKGIALWIDSPGGMVSGNFDLVDKMFALRGTKPVRAYASEHAYSAAFSIATVAQTIFVARSGGVGSVGVLTAHVDLSKALESYGYKITLIFAGKHKVDGNPYEPLPDDVKARIQARIDGLREEFAGIVARNRGMELDAVLATEALTYSADEALEVGFADRIGAFDDDAVAAFAADLEADEGDETMAEKNDKTAEQAALDQARAEGRNEGHAAGLAEGKAAGVKEGAAAERTRITAVIDSEAGKKRPKAALSAALKTDMTVEQATAFLGDLPEEKAEQPAEKGKDTFAQAMNQSDNPDLGAGGSDGAADADSADSALQAARSFGIPGLKAKK